VGIVGAPHDVVDPDCVSQANTDRILLEAQEDIAVEEVARPHVILEAVERLLVALAVRVVHGGEDVRSPGELEFHDGELESGVALEDPGEDHVAHRGGRVEGLRGSAGRVAERLLPRSTNLALTTGGGVQAERHGEGLRGRPERLVLGLIVAPVLERVLRDHRSGEASPRGPLQLFRALLDIVQVDHGDALEPARVRAAEVGEPVVVRPEDRGHEGGVGHLEVEEALRRVEHLSGHPIETHVREVLLGVISARRDVLEPTEPGDGLGGLEPSPGIGDEPDPGEYLVLLDHELIGAVDPHHPGRPVAEGLIDASGPQIGRLEDVRVGRQDKRGWHRLLLCEPGELVRQYYPNPRATALDRAARRAATALDRRTA